MTSLQVQKNVLDVSYHISQYRAIITELKDEIDRLKTKITDGDCGEETTAVTTTTAEQQMEQKKNTEKLKKLKEELLEHFREQMSLRWVFIHGNICVNVTQPSWSTIFM